jgi:hypothetical protein
MLVFWAGTLPFEQPSVDIHRSSYLYHGYGILVATSANLDGVDVYETLTSGFPTTRAPIHRNRIQNDGGLGLHSETAVG